MKKNIFIFGSIAGLIVSVLMLWSMARSISSMNFENGELIGYSSMLLAFSLIFVGVKNFRDKFNGGIISFGQAFKMGFFIALVASTFYVVAWVIDYYVFFPDFTDKYAIHMLAKLQESGASAAEIESKTKEMAQFKEWYKNPLFVILMTYMEILPLGTLIALICALILKRKEKKAIS
jgi:hypothetical protein